MSIMKWTEELSVGNTEIDCQHKALINIINRIDSCYSDGTNEEKIIELLPELKWYASEHFKHEEVYMEEIGYPTLQGHSDVHEKLIADLGEVIKSCLNGEFMEAEEMTEFFKKWLINHIKIEDMKYAEHAKNAIKSK